ncbi:MAG: hypothetical protein EA402_07680 [Planctomycetota bacterium]|nr:MAG: hypothetical protein EA402_07680 [Planctomycetota bacterium]
MMRAVKKQALQSGGMLFPGRDGALKWLLMIIGAQAVSAALGIAAEKSSVVITPPRPMAAPFDSR